MPTAVIMPKQGQSVESCILTEWYKSEGEQVSQGDLLFAYETDKAAFEEEAREDGILLTQFFGEGDEVPVLVNVAVIGKKGDDVEPFRPGADSGQESTDDQQNGGSGASGHMDAETDQVVGMEKTKPEAQQARAETTTRGISPRARKLAAEKRVSTAGLRGTGPGGRIIERDVQEEIRKGKRLTPLASKKMEQEGLRVPVSGKKPYGRITSAELQEASAQGITGDLAGDYTDTPLSGVRKLISSAMHRSLQNSAQLTHHMGADASAMMKIRREVKKRLHKGYAYNITMNDLVCYAVVRALKQHPEANAHFLEGTVRTFHRVHLGIAVDTERGLLVPTLRNADDLSLTGLSARLKELAESARQGSVSPDLLAPESASFTVSNLGNYGVEMFTPVINLPQAGILGVNTIVQRPAVLPGGAFGFLPYMGLSLTYDHRALDGGPATLFLAEIRNQIETLDPALLDQ